MAVLEVTYSCKNEILGDSDLIKSDFFAFHRYTLIFFDCISYQVVRTCLMHMFPQSQSLKTTHFLKLVSAFRFFNKPKMTKKRKTN